MSELRALLLTDVVDSTKLSERLGDQAMAELWAAHDRVARDLLPRWRGREIDKTDGMLLLFERADDALGYALAYHHALRELPVALEARAGLHVGPVMLRENAAADVERGAKPLEVDGLAKPTAARVMAVARGGQTLLTDDARQALGLDDRALQSHGHWMLKGLAEPVELFEPTPADGSVTAPDDGDKAYRVVRQGDLWLPARDVPNNLPQQITSFVGREREQREVRDAIAASRLVTLLGMGGLGKTRLSLRVAATLLADFVDGVWFLDLAPIRDPALVVAEAAQVLDVREEPGRPLVQTICAALRSRRTLLIFDNCEHLLKACADLAFALLRAAPGVRILASSREALRVPGEQVYPVLPLPVPARGTDLQALQRSSAVRLFVERAQAHKPAFRLTQRDAPAVAELVERLEGIPLALELAAARVRVLSLADINLRLKERYKLLVGGGRVLQERQQTLRALVDWSYDMLEQPEQIVFNRLAVFAGGFDLDAAETVCGAEPVSPDDVQGLLASLVDKALVMDLLASLVEKSLVTVDELPDGTRYRMLETIRDYAREKLHALGDHGPTAERHCLYYFDLAKRARDGMQGPEQGAWLDRLDTELDNLRAAIDVAQSDDGGVDPFVAVKLAVALQNFWIMRGYLSEGRAVVRAQLSRRAIQASAMAQAHALYVGAALALMQSDLAEALRMLQECLALRRGLGKVNDIAATLSTLAVARLSSGDSAGALEAETEALQLFRQCGYRVGEAISWLQLGQIEAYQGHHTEAREHLEASLAMAREIEHPETEGEAELVLGELVLSDGDFDAAEQGFERSLAVCEAAGDRRGTANAEWALARIDLHRGRLEAAGARLRDALTAFHEYDMREPWLGCLEDHALFALRRQQLPLAVALAAAAQALRERARLPRSPDAQRRSEAILAELRAASDGDGFDPAWQSALHWSSAEAQAQALGLTSAADAPT